MIIIDVRGLKVCQRNGVPSYILTSLISDKNIEDEVLTKYTSISEVSVKCQKCHLSQQSNLMGQF